MKASLPCYCTTTAKGENLYCKRHLPKCCVKGCLNRGRLSWVQKKWCAEHLPHFTINGERMWETRGEA